MDLRLMEAIPTDQERAAVDALLGEPKSGWLGGARTAVDGHMARGGRAQREQRHLLLPALHALQSEVGWISEGGLNYVCMRLVVPPAEAYGVASFYSLFSLTEQPPNVLHVCDDIACRPHGADALCAEMEGLLGPEGENWVRSPCVGLCDRSPAAFLQRADSFDVGIGSVTPEVVSDMATADQRRLPPLVPQRGSPELRLLRRIGNVDPESLDEYRASGGYEALARALQLGPGGVISEIQASGLLGRGGAAFPAGVKWEAVAKTPATPRYIICNADESEPGTFKDRVLMEGDPYAVIEAMTIAGFAVGARRGYVYIRGEYPRATALLENAVDRARAEALLGSDVMGGGFSFEVELRRGAGAYICGEETALMNSIEGYRGEPRNKPPFPTEEGLFGSPTLVNNVETLVCALSIVIDGGAAFARIGTAGSTGPKLFCLSGNVNSPGTYEVPFGASVADLVELAGGVPKNRNLQAVLVGGAAGTFVGPNELDVPLTFEDTQAEGMSLGSGAVIVFDDSVDMAGILMRIAAFFRDESCGQCVPCRVGTVRQEEALVRLISGSDESSLLTDVARVMTDASICGLGQTAASAVQSALRLGLVGGPA